MQCGQTSLNETLCLRQHETADTQTRPAEPEISVSDAPDLPEPSEDKNWFDETLLAEPIDEIGEF